MVWVALGLGSSVDPENQLSACLDDLLLNFHDLSLSSVFESEAVGFAGDNFLNMAVGFETDLPLVDLRMLLKNIEDKIGIDRAKTRYSPRKIDIDLLLYHNYCGEYSGIKLPRSDITENAYVLWPLSQISHKVKDPQLKMTYQELWKVFYLSEERELSQNNLWPVNFTWHGKQISHQKRKSK